MLNYSEDSAGWFFLSTLFGGSFQRESSDTFSWDLEVYLEELISVSALVKRGEKAGTTFPFSVSRLFKLLALQHTVTARPIETNCYFVEAQLFEGEEARLFRLDGFQCSPPAELTRLLNIQSSPRGTWPILAEISAKQRESSLTNAAAYLCFRDFARSMRFLLKFNGITLLGKCNI